MPTLKELSNESGLSQSTLSRALNHCAGTGIEAARIAGGLREKYAMNPFSANQYAIGLILPEGPKFFWSSAYRHLREALAATGLPFRPAFIESMRDSCSAIALAILREMESSGIGVVIMPYMPACADYISSSAMKFFFLCEPAPLCNTFSFCADGYRDGYRLGELMRELHPARKRIVVVMGDNESSLERRRGFTEAMGRDRIAGCISVPSGHMPLLPSIIARELTAHRLTDLDALCCLSGVTHKAALAIHKLGLLRDVDVIGFETPSADNQYMQDGTISLLMAQDIAGQARAVVEAAAEYINEGLLPRQKYTYIESTPLINRSEGATE